jgi:hypothetical protein
MLAVALAEMYRQVQLQINPNFADESKFAGKIAGEAKYVSKGKLQVRKGACPRFYNSTASDPELLVCEKDGGGRPPSLPATLPSSLTTSRSYFL